jgi:hypothetical protein
MDFVSCKMHRLWWGSTCFYNFFLLRTDNTTCSIASMTRSGLSMIMK